MKCPYCDYKFDFSSDLIHNPTIELKPNEMPEGSISICIKCMNVSRKKGNELIKVKNISKLPIEIKAEIEQLQQAMIKVQKENRWLK